MFDWYLNWTPLNINNSPKEFIKLISQQFQKVCKSVFIHFLDENNEIYKAYNTSRRQNIESNDATCVNPFSEKDCDISFLWKIVWLKYFSSREFCEAKILCKLWIYSSLNIELNGRKLGTSYAKYKPFCFFWIQSIEEFSILQLFLQH